VHRELRRPGVTLVLLWEEYCDTTSDSFSYSWFCERYKERASRLKLSLRQVHVAGDKLFVDYSGHTMEVIDALTGKVLTAQIFVAVLGASNYSYAEATLTQSLPDWIASGGAARQAISDNLKAGVTPRVRMSGFCSTSNVRCWLLFGLWGLWATRFALSTNPQASRPPSGFRRLAKWHGRGSPFGPNRVRQREARRRW
jgi:hypothetical protein